MYLQRILFFVFYEMNVKNNKISDFNEILFLNSKYSIMILQYDITIILWNDHLIIKNEIFNLKDILSY